MEQSRAKTMALASLHQSSTKTVEKLVNNWKEIIANLPDYLAKKRPKLTSLIIKQGIPYCYRVTIWSSLATHSRRQSQPTLYQEIVKATSSLKLKPDEAINKDVLRTIPARKDVGDTKEIWREKLKTVLRAIALLFPEMGYVQGMSVIAGFSLSLLDEEDTFWLFLSLIDNYGMKNYFTKDIPNLRKAFYVHESLLKNKLPELFAHLAKIGVLPSMYCASWFLTLFAFSWPTELVTRIWDLFFCESQEVLHRVALVFMRQSQGVLMKASELENAVPFFQEPWGTIDPEKLLAAVISSGSLAKEIKKYEAEFAKSPNKSILALSC